MAKAPLLRENIYLELACSSRGSVHYPHGEKYGGVQADMELEEKLRVLCMDLQAAEVDYVSGWTQLEHETSKLIPTVTRFLQQGHSA